MGLTEREVAERLHLNTKIIAQLESEDVTTSLPPVFIRGYLKSYAVFLEIDKDELHKVLEEINDAPSAIITPGTLRKFTAPRSHYHIIKTCSYFIFAIWIGCTAIWWYMHSNKPLTTALTAPTSTKNIFTTIENTAPFAQHATNESSSLEQPSPANALNKGTGLTAITAATTTPATTTPSPAKPLSSTMAKTNAAVMDDNDDNDENDEG